MKIYSIEYSFTRDDRTQAMTGRSLEVGLGLETVMDYTVSHLKVKYDDYDEGSFKLESHLDMNMSKLHERIQACSDVEDDEEEAVEDLINDLPTFDSLIKEQ